MNLNLHTGHLLFTAGIILLFASVNSIFEFIPAIEAWRFGGGGISAVVMLFFIGSK